MGGGNEDKVESAVVAELNRGGGNDSDDEAAATRAECVEAADEVAAPIGRSVEAADEEETAAAGGGNGSALDLAAAAATTPAAMPFKIGGGSEDKVLSESFTERFEFVLGKLTEEPLLLVGGRGGRTDAELGGA